MGWYIMAKHMVFQTVCVIELLSNKLATNDWSVFNYNFPSPYFPLLLYFVSCFLSVVEYCFRGFLVSRLLFKNFDNSHG